MKDEELVEAIRHEVQEEEAEYARWLASEGGRALLEPGARVVAHAEELAVQTLAPRTTQLKRLPLQKRIAPVLAGSALLAAAAFAILVSHPQTSSIPPYEVSIVAGAEQSTRAATDEARALVYRRGAPFDVTLRPSTRADGDVSVRAFLVGAAGTMQIATESERSASGVLHVRGVWPEAATPREIVFVVARPSELPDVPPAGDTPSLRVLRIPVEPPRN